ncbi:cupin [Altererythrobacter sp. B11]|uniref:cupin domain-containing protein n=1 Tax=Altererythrobacter sp. B11 TaxID=2060312 RepID=UPI000DC6E116|nr:cupin domain-containing protein [Altererythrobacter sp. B11]BBC71808.1 cupin [Altererythrobacter sp. B11]
MSVKPVRRIVTGHDAQGRSIFLADGAPERVQRIGGETGPMFHELWNTRETPALIDAESGEPSEEGIRLAPPPQGTRIRILDIPPDDPSLDELSPEEARAHFAEVGAAEASSHGEGSGHARMHRTETIDYGIVLEGELVLILDEGETLCRPGDVIIQRGTNHGWANRSSSNCRIAFILIDGSFAEDLR